MTRAKYERMIASGKIKDDAKKRAILKMIDQLNQQIDNMDHLLSDRKEESHQAKKEVATPGPNRNRGKKKRNQAEQREHAINEIHKFYSRQHKKKESGFDDLKNMQRMEKGEFTIFCKDFDMRLPLQKYLEIFRTVSL